MKTSVYTKRGFTLIELLVVVVIIIILAAILLPVFAKARDKAREVVCASNARQIGIALRLYLNDYDGNFPVMNTAAGDAVGDGAGTFYQGVDAPGSSAQLDYVKNYGFFAQLGPYLKSDEVRICPSDPDVRAVPTVGKRYSSYTYRHYIGLTFASVYVNGWAAPPMHDLAHIQQPYKMKYFADSSKNFIILERNSFHSRSCDAINDVNAGSCRMMFVFGDCHAKSHPINAIMNWNAGGGGWNHYFPLNGNFGPPIPGDLP